MGGAVEERGENVVTLTEKGKESIAEARAAYALSEEQKRNKEKEVRMRFRDFFKKMASLPSIHPLYRESGLSIGAREERFKHACSCLDENDKEEFDTLLVEMKNTIGLTEKDVLLLAQSDLESFM